MIAICAQARVFEFESGLFEFNFMLANATHEAPVFVDHGHMSHVHVLSLGKKKGLWKRGQHYDIWRATCACANTLRCLAMFCSIPTPASQSILRFQHMPALIPFHLDT